MKSERRHELEKNVLADRVGAGLESVHSYWPMILGGLAILVVGSLAWGLYSSSARKQAAEAWTDYYFSMAGGEAEAFLDLSERYPNSSAAGWARQTAGNGFLERGVDALYVNKSEGESLIKQAISEFEQLEDSSNQELRAKALYGLAQAHESLGDLDTAIAYYEKLMKATPREALLRSASERLAFLNSDSGKEFYAWFGTLEARCPHRPS